MATDATPMPETGATQHSVTVHTGLDADSESPAGQSPAGAMPLDLVELELALDLTDIAVKGFSHAVRDAADVVNGEFLFDLPASGLVDDAQRIAVICLSRRDGGRYGLVLLGDDGQQARTMEPDDRTADLVRFAKAFVDVLEKL